MELAGHGLPEPRDTRRPLTHSNDSAPALSMGPHLAKRGTSVLPASPVMLFGDISVPYSSESRSSGCSLWKLSEAP